MSLRTLALASALAAACDGAQPVSAPDATLPADVSHADAAPADVRAPDVSEPPGPPRFHRVARVATHNSYWLDRMHSLELFASGTQHRLLDQLLYEGARAVEIDVHRDRTSAHAFRVYHTSSETNSLCSPLSECVETLRAFHAAVPDHEAVTVVVELKELTEANFDDAHTPADLDAVFASRLGEMTPSGFRSWLYTPRDLLARCAPGATLVDCAAREGWPTVAEMRGRFVLAVIGNLRVDYTTEVCQRLHPGDPCAPSPGDDVQGHGPAGWVEYATWGAGVAERAGFPMRSNWVRFNAGADTEAVDPARLRAAEAASVFLQVEDLTDPSVPDFIERGGLVRGADSFSLDDQRRRVAAGYQLLQTDHPWLALDDRGPDRPLRPLRPRPDDDALREPGKRILVRGPLDPARAAFASTRVTPGGCTEWRALVSVTRAPTDARYAPAPERPSRPRGVGCLRASLDPARDDLDSASLCRSTEGDELASITWTTLTSGATQRMTAQSPPRSADGPGEWLRMVVCVTAEGTTVTGDAAGAVGPDGEPLWHRVGSARFDGALASQGLSAQRDVLFVAARRDRAYASGLDLSRPVTLRAEGERVTDDATLTDLSFPAPTPACHDPLYPTGCRAP